MILGTAGHVDHGKTALVKALTGVDTDRLEEEKRRGITIDLGFAPLSLGDGLTLGVVDVPGHEAFVRNMLAGATGVDLALLVIAADEGVMPQTREHLAILSLLGIRGGVVALTKADLADDDWLELVTEDVRATLADTPMASAEIVRTSVVSGAGLDALRDAIRRAACEVPARDATDLFRMPIDRAFTVRGTGTVVTGTVWSGALARDAVVRILPGDRTARVRGLESHGHAAETAQPGTRVAVALVGVEVGDVPRGTVIVSDAGWAASRTLLADVALLEGAPRALGPRTAVRFHLGTADVGARVVTTGGALEPGTRKGARVVLDQPVPARAGDRFVLRGGSPLITVGGGVVRDPLPPHRRSRPAAFGGASIADRLNTLLAAAGQAGVDTRSLAVRLGETPAGIAGLLAGERAVLQVGERIFSTATVQEIGDRLEHEVDEYHAGRPLERGAPLGLMRSKVAADTNLMEEVIRLRTLSSALEIRGSLVSRTGWTPRLSPAQRDASEALRGQIEAAGREPPSGSELSGRFGADTVALLKHLEREGQLVQVEEDRWYAIAAVDLMVSALRMAMVPGTEYGPAVLRDVIGSTRKFLIPFLEYCDRSGVTERRSSGRVLGSAKQRGRSEVGA